MKAKVLLVDDEPDFLKAMGMTIESWGYEVLTASSGAEALRIVKEQSPAVVILDQVMPVMNGITTLAEIRKFDEQVPAVILTAHQPIIPIKEAEDLKVKACIPKSSSDAALQAALLNLTQRRK